MTWTPRPDQYDTAWFGPPPALVLRHLQRLRADRAAGDPRFVEAGKLTADEARHRAACADGLVRLWTRLAEGAAMEAEAPGISWAALHADAAAAFDVAIARAKADPTDDRMTTRYVFAFVEYWLQPVDDGTPLLFSQRLAPDRAAA